ncbi:hypothetical protein Tco_1034816 [Tanacetum coccineum]
MTNGNPSSVNIKQHYGNPDSGTVVEYRRTSLASLDVSVLDKPHFKLENMSRRFIHESNPDDAVIGITLVSGGGAFVKVWVPVEGGFQWRMSSGEGWNLWPDYSFPFLYIGNGSNS